MNVAGMKSHKQTTAAERPFQWAKEDYVIFGMFKLHKMQLSNKSQPNECCLGQVSLKDWPNVGLMLVKYGRSVGQVLATILVG